MSWRQRKQTEALLANLDFVFRNTGIETLMLVGFLTDECVAATACHAADIGYDILLVHGAAQLKETCNAVIWSIDDTCLKANRTDEALQKLERASTAKATKT